MPLERDWIRPVVAGEAPRDGGRIEAQPQRGCRIGPRGIEEEDAKRPKLAVERAVAGPGTDERRGLDRRGRLADAADERREADDPQTTE
ncbi:MAG: hypothetical protein M5T61_09115 [Acidimicrobiia bacterium]|nr:hypothetical protein [Acidimicrobiia bacterium]